MRFGQSEKDLFVEALNAFAGEVAPLPGIADPQRAAVLADQLVSSIRRIEYLRVRCQRPVDARRADVQSDLFDPILGAIHLRNSGEIEEAVWLTFFATNFGKHVGDGWKLAKNVFGSFGVGPAWTRQQYGKNSGGFDAMLQENAQLLSQADLAGRYSNHRQYTSKQPKAISSAVSSFYMTTRGPNGFSELLLDVHKSRGQEPGEAFDGLYTELDEVHGFGRLGKFDFLTMLGKLELAPIQPNSTYLIGATGPLRGAKLLFFDDPVHQVLTKELRILVDRLDEYLDVGKQPIEDALCNWQKSPGEYLYFRG